MSEPDLFSWEAERDEAMERVAANAEDSCPGFAERARAFVLDYLAEHGPTSGERLTDACKAAGLVPHDDRAFGPVYHALARERKIERIGWALRAKGHGTGGGSIWGLVGEQS